MIDHLADLMRTLTPRQLEALAHTCQGRDRDEMAALMGCAPWTVSQHLKGAYRRLGVDTYAEGRSCVPRVRAAVLLYRAIVQACPRRD